MLGIRIPTVQYNCAHQKRLYIEVVEKALYVGCFILIMVIHSLLSGFSTAKGFFLKDPLRLVSLLCALKVPIAYTMKYTWYPFAYTIGRSKVSQSTFTLE